jgi:hypothetical protein
MENKNSGIQLAIAVPTKNNQEKHIVAEKSSRATCTNVIKSDTFYRKRSGGEGKLAGISRIPV